MRIGVLRGGVSQEYDISIKTGSRVLSALYDSGHVPIDMFITKDGTFHVQGVPREIEDIPEIADAVFIALHGELGEDGRVQEILENLGVPFNGSRSAHIGKTHNKLETKNFARGLGLKVPDSYTLHATDFIDDEDQDGFSDQAAREAWTHVAPPWVVKPVNGGSSRHTYYAGTFPELSEAIWRGLSAGQDLIVETYVPGREFQVMVAENFRNQPLYMSPILEIFHNQKILDENKRLAGDYQSKIAKNIDEALARNLEEIAQTLFSEMKLSGYVMMDFKISPRGIVLLEIDALPPLDEHSPLSRILHEIGAPVSYLVETSLS